MKVKHRFLLARIVLAILVYALVSNTMVLFIRPESYPNHLLPDGYGPEEWVVLPFHLLVSFDMPSWAVIVCSFIFVFLFTKINENHCRRDDARASEGFEKEAIKV